MHPLHEQVEASLQVLGLRGRQRQPGLQNLCRSGNTCRYRVLGGLVDASPTVRTAVRLTGLRICRRPTWPP
ncbi:MAG: hypothetical protein OXG36_03745, partial [Caldilineaceae bacterium]|nr:hypothetical protein [Caldilineaceae bacterium]